MACAFTRDFVATRCRYGACFASVVVRSAVPFLAREVWKSKFGANFLGMGKEGGGISALSISSQRVQEDGAAEELLE
jgi:hypothetical protein